MTTQKVISRQTGVEDTQYKWGFEFDYESDVAPRGLNEDIVRLISSKKGEPEWMLEEKTASAGVVGVRAADYLISLASAFRGELTIIALGPLTNVARAIDKEPRVARWVEGVVVAESPSLWAGDVDDSE